MINHKALKNERAFFKLLMIIAYISTFSFTLYLYVHKVYILAYNGLFCFALFVIIGIASYFTSKRTLLFRLSVLVAFHAFYFKVFFTGGALSPSLAEFIVPPAIAFFYKPVRDRYFFIILAILCIISMWPLTILGYVKNYFPKECAIENSILSTLFVFSIVGLYIYIFRQSIAKKNRQLKNSFNELKNTSQKLIESEKMASLGMMSAGVAHEINNPLNFIRGGIDMLSMQLSDSQEAKPFIHAIDEGVKRASSIVDSLGHFSRNTSSKDEVCDIHSIIDNCLTMINYRLNFKIEIIKKYCDEKPFTVIGNEGQLHQAILNIITNAEQAIHDEGTITIETCTNNENQELIISDTGVGIKPENISKIRYPFYTTKSPGKGTGLGLSIAYKIIEEHNGTIDVKSVPSKGTSFHISFKSK